MYYEVSQFLTVYANKEQFSADIIDLMSQIPDIEYDYYDGDTKTYFKIYNTEYRLSFENNGSYWSAFNINLLDDNYNHIALLYMISKEVYASPLNVILKIIRTETLFLCYAAYEYQQIPYQVGLLFSFHIYNDNISLLQLVHPNLAGHNFHKKYFTKRDISNNLLLTPARLLNSNNKLVSKYPLSCFYVNTTGIVNNSFYTFNDGEIGFFKDNILFK